ncbi:hypothetical protein VTH06DRAFT_7804 [Thermothelomyces fergusii]
MNTAGVGLAVTPTIISTFLSHYLNRRPLANKPTAHLSYDEGLHLIRSFLVHASRHTVEELQAFTGQWVPHPHWVRVDHVAIPEQDLARAAQLLAEQLGPEGIRQVGGREWWQWRKAKSPLKAEWIEMKADYQRRKKNADPGNRVMLYIHGGAYYFGSVDEHRYQIQRYARKLRARALAPRYRLAPQFPFPCGLQDCLATYLYLISQQRPNTIILAGDSAGGGMVLSLLVVLRDRGIPLPAGAVLISPWVDLTHSFPSLAGDCPLDYLPPAGFHHKPSLAWPPPDEDELEVLKKAAAAAAQKKSRPAEKSGVPTAQDVERTTRRLAFVIDGEQVEIKEQIQMYTTNDLLTHPLVSPALQPTLGGLPPLLITVGGGELLRDEQIYVAHKCANPAQYLPPEAMMDEKARALVDRYEPTDVQLQVWDDLCHVAPTLGFTRPAKYMYRSVAQFSAWALAKAQNTEVDILYDDAISVISSSSSSSSSSSDSGSGSSSGSSSGSQKKRGSKRTHGDSSSKEKANKHASIGKAGDPLPAFENHMIRQRVTRHGVILPLPEPAELPGCCMERDLVGVVKVDTARKWLEQRRRWDARFQHAKARVHRQRLRDVERGGYEAFGEGEGQGARSFADLERQQQEKKDEDAAAGEDGGLAAAAAAAAAAAPSAPAGPLSPDDAALHRTGVTGKRVMIGGLATPFSLRKEPETASMEEEEQAEGPSARHGESGVVDSGATAGSATFVCGAVSLPCYAGRESGFGEVQRHLWYNPSTLEEPELQGPILPRSITLSAYLIVAFFTGSA